MGRVNDSGQALLLVDRVSCIISQWGKGLWYMYAVLLAARLDSFGILYGVYDFLDVFQYGITVRADENKE